MEFTKTTWKDGMRMKIGDIFYDSEIKADVEILEIMAQDQYVVIKVKQTGGKKDGKTYYVSKEITGGYIVKLDWIKKCGLQEKN